MEENMEYGVTEKKAELPEEEMRAKIMEFEKVLTNHPDVKFGEDVGPLTHTFVDGAYVRQVTVPKGTFLTTEIHKIRHPFFVLKGECLVIDGKKKTLIKAPYWGVTEPGTKRAIYIIEETVWVTVHVTKSTDIDEIEKELIAPDFESLPGNEKSKEIEEV